VGTKERSQSPSSAVATISAELVSLTSVTGRPGSIADAAGDVDRGAFGLGAALGHAGPDGGAGGADGDGDPDRAGGGEAFEHHGAGRRKRT